jgi:hypothetical protein
LYRRPALEALTYKRGVRSIVEILGLEAEQAPNVKQAVEGMTAFRVRHVSLRCEVCSPHPDSNWTDCEHTIGVDMRGRGPRSKRPHRLAARNGGPAVSQAGITRIDDAAGRLVTELLVRCGVDPAVRHVLARRSSRDFDRRHAEHAKRVDSVARHPAFRRTKA